MRDAPYGEGPREPTPGRRGYPLWSNRYETMLTHLPSGCWGIGTGERSQHRNERRARELLRAALWRREAFGAVHPPLDPARCVDLTTGTVEDHTADLMIQRPTVAAEIDDGTLLDEVLPAAIRARRERGGE
jgi:hypothetical protein